MTPSNPTPVTPNPAPSGQTTPALAVLDTNAALDALLFADPGTHSLMQALRDGRMRWLATPNMRQEFAQVLARPMLAKHVIEGERTLFEFDQLAVMCGEVITAPRPTLSCRDADDQMFIELALRERAPWLITRDRDLLCLAKRARAMGLAILTPLAWAAAAGVIA
jgi:uncharacterized protein